MKYSFNVDAFKDAASKLGLTTTELAKKCGVDSSTLRKAARGEMLTLKSYSLIALGLDYDREPTICYSWREWEKWNQLNSLT